MGKLASVNPSVMCKPRCSRKVNTEHWLGMLGCTFWSLPNDRGDRANVAARALMWRRVHAACKCVWKTVADMAESSVVGDDDGSIKTNLKTLEEQQKIIDRAPFRRLKIDNADCLDRIEGREICGKCYKSRKFFCYTCYSPLIDEKYIPRIKVIFSDISHECSRTRCIL